MWANVGVLAGFGLVFLALTAVYFLATQNNKKAADTDTAVTA
jgi:putative membrane protein